MANTDASRMTKPPFKARFLAWWEGVDVEDLAHPPVPKLAPGKKDTVRKVKIDEKPELSWETPRVKVLQTIWGQGFSGPGDRNFCLWLAKPCALDPTMTVAELGAGLGGFTRLLHEEFGLWITGFERDFELARAAQEYSVMAGVGKKAPISFFDPDKFELKESSYDCILSRGTFYGVADKMTLLSVLEKALKPRGQLLFTDFVRTGATKEMRPAYMAWQAGEPVPADPWTVEKYQVACSERRLDLRITEDITKLVRANVLKSLADLLEKAEVIKSDPRLGEPLTEHVALWTRRVAAIDSGDIGYYRFHALKTGVDKMLSDW
ncbi:MAG: SAM-dependent methyltransferase [Pseudomonadota bacterium]